MVVKIAGMGKSVPKKIMHNSDFDPKLETSDEWIRSHTGIEARHIANEEETTSFLATEACKNAIKSAQAKGSKISSIEEIDLIVCSTITGDYASFPATSCVIQKNLGAVNAAAYDVSAACSGFIYGVESATALMLRNKMKYALVIGAETLSRITNWEDRGTCVLFGDGAGAALLELTEGEADGKTSAVYSSILGADGTGEKHLYQDENGFISMNGRAVYNFAVDKITTLIVDLMEKEGWSIDDVDYFVLHQANERIIQAAAKRLKYPDEKFIYNMQKYGNTSAATIPITLADMEEQGTLKQGMKIVTAGFGGGLTWAGATIVW